jgi:predicted nucleotidyltransferase
MNIGPKDKIAGYPAKRIRDAMREVRHLSSWGIEYFASYLKVTSDEAARVLIQLEGLGLVTPAQPLDGEKQWHHTDEAGRLLNANAKGRIDRAKADRLVEQFLERVREVNRSTEFLFWVDEVIVFGSYNSDKETLGDVDLVVSLKPREEDPEKHGKLAEDCVDKAAAKGRHFPTIIHRMYWPTQEVLQYLKKKSPYLKFHDADDEVLRTASKRTLYKRS